MGQSIVIKSTENVDDSIIVTMNRSLTSQVGEGYDSQAAADAGDSFGALLAARLFDADGSIDRVYVASNTVVLKRPGGWDEASVSSVSGAIEDLFLFYPAV
ncbi:MAG: hypothetical protein ABFR53_07700 [Actinomycetota bacterium]